jgi:hypothetical protein
MVDLGPIVTRYLTLRNLTMADHEIPAGMTRDSTLAVIGGQSVLVN